MLTPDSMYLLGRMCLTGWDQWCFDASRRVDTFAGWRLVRAAASKGHAVAQHVLARLEACQEAAPSERANEFVRRRWIAACFDDDYSALGYFYRGISQMPSPNAQLLGIAAELGDVFALRVLNRDKRSRALLETLVHAGCKEAEVGEALLRIAEGNGDGAESVERAAAELHHPGCMAKMVDLCYDSLVKTESKEDLYQLVHWLGRNLVWMNGFPKCYSAFVASDWLRVDVGKPESLIANYILGFQFAQIHALAPHMVAEADASFCAARRLYEATTRACRRSALATVWLLRAVIHRDVARLIGKMVWRSRHNVCIWHVAAGVVTAPKSARRREDFL